MEQAEKIALSLEGEEIIAVYSSPLKRAIDTAGVIAKARGLEVVAVPELKEIDFGEFEGLTITKLKGRYKDLWEEWIRGNPSLYLPGGESREELQRRAWPAIERITEEHPDGIVAVFGHFFINLAIICRALGLGPHYIRRMRQNLAAISILEITGQGNSLLLLNDTCHLEI